MASKPSTDVDPPGQATLPAGREALGANRAQTLEASSKVPAQGLCNIFVMWNYPSGPPLQHSCTSYMFLLQGISSQVFMLISPQAQVHFEELGIVAALLAWTLPLPVDDQRYEYPSALSSWAEPHTQQGAAVDVNWHCFCRLLFRICRQNLSACHTTPPSLTLSGAANGMHEKSAAGCPPSVPGDSYMLCEVRVAVSSWRDVFGY